MSISKCSAPKLLRGFICCLIIISSCNGAVCQTELSLTSLVDKFSSPNAKTSSVYRLTPNWVGKLEVGDSNVQSIRFSHGWISGRKPSNFDSDLEEKSPLRLVIARGMESESGEILTSFAAEYRKRLPTKNACQNCKVMGDLMKMLGRPMMTAPLWRDRAGQAKDRVVWTLFTTQKDDVILISIRAKVSREYGQVIELANIEEIEYFRNSLTTSDKLTEVEEREFLSEGEIQKKRHQAMIKKFDHFPEEIRQLVVTFLEGVDSKAFQKKVKKFRAEPTENFLSKLLEIVGKHDSIVFGGLLEALFLDNAKDQGAFKRGHEAISHLIDSLIDAPTAESLKLSVVVVLKYIGGGVASYKDNRMKTIDWLSVRAIPRGWEINYHGGEFEAEITEQLQQSLQTQLKEFVNRQRNENESNNLTEGGD